MQDLMEQNLIAMRLKARFNETLDHGDLPSEILMELCTSPKDESVTELPLFACGGKREIDESCSAGTEAAGGPSRSGGAAAFRLRSKSPSNTLFPPHTNRGVDKYGIGTTELPDPQPGTQYCLGGYDGGVEVGFTGDWAPAKFAKLKSQLDKARQASETDEGDEKYIELGGIAFHVKPHSAGGHVFYRYVIEGGGTKVYIHHNPQGQIQGIRVRYGFDALAGRDLFEVHAAFLEWIKDLGFTSRKECVSRVDLQILLMRDIMEIAAILSTNRVISRARQDHIHRNRNSGRMETYTIGSKIQLCIYDKKQELLKGRDEVKMFTLIEECLGGVMPEYLTRVEFRLRREVLNEMSIDTLEDLKKCEVALVEYLTNEWFRLLEDEKTRGYENKQATHELWREVQDLFRAYFPGEEREQRPVTRGRKKVLCTGQDLKDQALGCLSSAVALCMGYVKEPKKALDYLVETITENISKVVERSREKVKELGIIRGVESILTDDWWIDPRYACESSDDALDGFREIWDEDLQYEKFRNYAVAGCPF